LGRRQHLGLVDVVDAQRLQDLRLHEMADPGLGHDRDGDRGLDLLDQAGIAHPGDPAILSDVGGDALQRHHRTSAGLLGDPGVLGSDNVHDHAAFQHLGQPGLDLEGRLHARLGNGITVAFAHRVLNSTPASRSLTCHLKRALLIAALVVACQSAAPTPRPSATLPTSRYAPEPATHLGATLVMADWEPPVSLDPIHAATANDLRVAGLLFAPLWGRDPDLKAYPELVHEVPSAANGDVKLGKDGVSMTVDLKLAPGLRWSDGQPITADDVIFTVDAICSADMPARDQSGFDHISSQERRSDSELIWHFGPGARGRCGLR